MFVGEKYMGSDILEPMVSVTESGPVDEVWQQNTSLQNLIMYERFADTYLSGLSSFHAYAQVDTEGTIDTMIAFYQAADEPSWYYTLCRSRGNIAAHRTVLDRIIQVNEDQGRLKFYTLISGQHVRAARRFGWSQHNSQRYGYFDEFTVPAKCQCYYSNSWDLLFKKALLAESVVQRCSYLKQEYRDRLPQGGNI